MVPASIKPARGKASEDDSEPAFPEGGDIFDEDDPWPELPDDAVELEPEPRSSARQSSERSVRDRHVEAREAADEQVDARQLSSPDAAHVAESRQTGPPRSQDAVAEGVDLDRPLQVEPCPLHTFVEAADPAE